MSDERSAGQTICEAIAFRRLLRLVTTSGDRMDVGGTFRSQRIEIHHRWLGLSVTSSSKQKNVLLRMLEIQDAAIRA
jgi:hypothetical protein